MDLIALLVWSLGLRLKIILPHPVETSVVIVWEDKYTLHAGCIIPVTCTGYELVQGLTLSCACLCTRH